MTHVQISSYTESNKFGVDWTLIMYSASTVSVDTR